MERRRHITYHGNYFRDFYEEQARDVQDKIDWTFIIIETLKIIPEKYLKHITGTDGIYEIRVQRGSNEFRIFCFFDKDNLIVLGNGFQKKTEKTPQNEIEKAIKIKKEYEKENTNNIR